MTSGITLARTAIRVSLAAWAVAAGPVSADPAGDPRDQPYLSVVVNQALETQRTNVEVPWSNPDTGNRGTIVVERTFYQAPQRPCREYRRTVERGGGPAEVIRGTGCRIGPAVWTLDEVTVPPPAADPAAPGSGGTSAPTSPPSPPPSPPPAVKPTPQPTPTQAKRPSDDIPRRPETKAAKQPSSGGTTAGEKPAAPSPAYTLPSKTAL